jgi:peroxin-19
MERMQESGERTTAALAQDDESTDLVSQLLKAAATREAPSNENVDLNDILMRAMEQIANKELLYEPMQELHEKFGPWIAENKGKGKVSDEEMARYEYQAQVVEQIVTKFNEEGYSDGNPECRAYIWEKVQELHGDGNPPEELLRNPFAEELNASGLDASGAQPPDCQPQ